jgi:hypothetical protein
MVGLAMTLVIMMSACVYHATSPGPVSAISGQCSQASAKQASVDLQAVVDEFVQSIPAANTTGYADLRRDPNGVNALVDGFTKIAAGNLVAACQALEPVNYRVTLTTDRTTGRDVVLLRERRTQGRFARAWGFYLIAWPPGAKPSTLIVEAPHTCPDTNVIAGCQGGDRFTHLVAVKVFQKATARYLFINGADRRANGTFGPTQCKQDSHCADMAHQPESPFEKIYEKVVSGLGSSAKVYQSHRFLSAEHDPIDNVPGTSGPANVVVSAGITSPSPLATDVARGIEAEERSFFHVCLFKASETCSQLGATTNIQKDHLSGGRFVHVEASDQVVREPCDAPCRRDELATAIAAAMK